MSVVIETTLGDITIDLYVKERPNTCLNFLKLCKVKYYNLCLFHKIERNFIAQTGDPTGTGRGGESVFCQLYGDQAKYFDSEFKPRLKHERRGTVSMVNNGNNMSGSQFFITLGENLVYLDEVHTVFGEVAEGFDVILKLNETICNDENRPYQDIRITHTVILHDPFEDPNGLEIPDRSPEPTKEQLESGYIAADEEIDDTKGKTAEEIEEKIKESEAKARATILEMVGDIPDADIKPPENVLFVCKLNPVTTSEDLEIIFSRFGQIISCEVIKDKKTGDSLQYAFIEFEKEQDCENAFFKMDNVLIDDRRIHVDFSQSVSKMYWDRGSKFQKSKTLSQNLILKNSSKETGDYDLIFENDNPKGGTLKKNEKIHRSKSPKHDNFGKSIHRKKYRSRSPILKKEKTYFAREYQDEQLHKSERNHSLKYFKGEAYSSYSKYKNRNYKEQFNESSKYSSRKSKNYSISEHSKRHLESHQKNKSSGSRYRCDFTSPNRDIQKSQDKERKQNLSSYDHSTKYLDKYDELGDYRRDKKCKSSHKEAKKSKDIYSHDNRRYERMIVKSKKKKIYRSPLVSSSSSSSSPKTKKKKYEKASNSSDSSSDSSTGNKSRKNIHSQKVLSNTFVSSKKYKS